jgi:hypothetical protein
MYKTNKKASVVKSVIFILSISIFSCNGNRNNKEVETITVSTDANSSSDFTKVDSTYFNYFQNLAGKKLYDIGRDATNNSYPGGVKTARYKADPKISMLEIIFKENSECKILFQPISNKEIVTKTVKWSFLFPNKILLEDNLFAKVEVTNNAFALSEDKFYDYFLIMKEIEVTNEGLRFDIRNTNRENFFVQYAIAENSGETNSQSDYALKIMNELNFDYKLVWRYLYYYGLTEGM